MLKDVEKSLCVRGCQAPDGFAGLSRRNLLLFGGTALAVAATGTSLAPRLAPP